MEKLNEVFYNSKTGYISKKKFVDVAKLLKIKKKDAEDFYEKQAVNQIYKKSDQKNKFRSIESPRYEPGDLQIDLQILTRFPKNENKKYLYLLNILDVYSRYVKSYPLKSKSPDEIYPYIKKYIEDFRKLYPKNEISVTVDKGNEFLGKVKKYLNEQEIKIYIATPVNNTKNRNYLVERYHKTFWEKLRKILTHEESLKWIDYYEDITDNYNNTIHSKTKMTPKSIFIDKQLRSIETQLNLKPQNKNENFQVGDVVRVLKNKKEFTKKSFTANWSINKFKISRIEGNRYFVTYMNGNDKKGSYLARELQKIDEDMQNKDEYIRKTKNRKKEVIKVRKLRKEKIHDVDDEGKYKVNKRLKPLNEKRIINVPERFGY